MEKESSIPGRWDGAAFAERVEPLRGKLFRTACVILGSPADAADALDDAVCRAFAAVGQLREAALFESWLTRILINRCNTLIKRRKREIPTHTLPEDGQAYFDALPMRDAVMRLPGEYRQVIALRYFADMTVRQIAQILDCPEGTAKSRLRRAITLLRLEWEEEA